MTHVEPSDAPMTVFEAIYSLRATRIYEDRPVPKDVLDQILQAGTMACSSGNTQPWEFVVVTDPDLKKRIKVEMVEAFEAVAADRVQKPEDLIDGAGRPVTGHDAVENIEDCAEPDDPSAEVYTAESESDTAGDRAKGADRCESVGADAQPNKEHRDGLDHPQVAPDYRLPD